jgi:ankyrin repeat protein
LKEKQRSWIIEAAQLLIDNGSDPSLLNKQNMSPFMLAVEKGCFAVLQKLLDVNKKQLSSQCNKEGNTILHLFVSHAINEINVQNVKMSVGKFIRDIHDSDDSLKTIFREMAAIANKEGLKPIHLFLKTYSVKYSSEEEERLMDYLRFLVETLESDINSSVLSEKTEEIEFVSHLAAKCLSSKMIEYLLSKKLSLEQLDGTQRTPLAVAIKAKNIKIAKLLIESGSDVKFKSVNDFNRSLLLIESINNNITFELIPLLVVKGANVNEEDDKTGNTALHYVASRAEQKGALDAVVALIKYGANVNAVNKQGLNF